LLRERAHAVVWGVLTNATDWTRGVCAASAATVLLGSAFAAASQPEAGAPPAPTTSAPAASATAPAASSAAPPAGSSAPLPTASAPTPPAQPASPPLASAGPPARVPAPTPAARLGAPGKAFVHLHVDYPGAWLETRDYVDEGAWRRACTAPCDRTLVVEGIDLRVAAPSMTTSNVFRIDPGSGQAQLKVSGGSASSRTTGIVGMSAGVPVTLAGMAMYGYGRYADSTGLQTAGIITLAVGAVTVLGSLPFLAHGGTKVRDAKGKVIAAVTSGARF